MQDDNGVQSAQAPSNINDIASVENPAYDQMRQDWNNGQYVSGVDGFDDNNNPIFGDNGSYNAAL
ncbi:hypothetical protein BDV24DRAFT_145907 [Aspergillus arachidicola]|uniref:Uncharacterized protein n=1 Tax=Aspergillus arachidicola TaxID=656916 RepID=A0A5N6XME9_9EURO|nr:hypothetical protein BDV24DRAFT_145907 [Aspergillus arachidicola]